MLAALQASFGFSSFRPGQAEAVTGLLSGQDTLVVMPTGAGKSLVYQFAALQKPGLTLVLSPLIALMKDQVDALGRLAIPAAYINSAQPAAEQANRLRQLEQGKYRLIYVAPERLRSLAFLEALRSQPLDLLAVDEAHCVSEWGHDFRPDYLHIARFRASLGGPLTAALTATATPKLQGDIVRLLGLPESACRIVTGFNRPNLSLNVQYTNGLPAKLGALSRLVAAGGPGAIIVYTGTRHDAEEVAEFAGQMTGVSAAFYHAGLPAEERARIQEAFTGGKANLIVATNAFGMGIDRPDVRQVIHFSMPGSLEAYYQEAGRAGRDGNPAAVTLLYDPHDRALQEWFIETSVVSPDDLRLIYTTVRGGSQVWTTLEDLSRLTGLHPVQIRVGLAELERAGALERLGDEGLRMLFRRGEWDREAIGKAALHSRAHLQHRRAQLDGIIAYAEANACRRRAILRYFGDAGPAQAPDCCDHCRGQQAAPQPSSSLDRLSHTERAALILLDAARRLNPKVGKTKLARILHGSMSKEILEFHYERSLYYAKLAAIPRKYIGNLADQLVEMGYFKVTGGDYPVISLTSKGEMALKNKTAIPVKLPKKLNEAGVAQAKAKHEAGGTVEYTAQLFSRGISLEQIAGERGLTVGTIYSHLAELIGRGRFTPDQVIPPEPLAQIEAAIQQAGPVQSLASIKALLPEEIDYNMIRCVVAGRRRIHSQASSQPGITPDEFQDAGAEASIEAFLNKPHPRPLTGPWMCGWSLGFHSRFSGAEWSRSSVGDLVYRLKYENDFSVIPALVDLTLAIVKRQPEFGRVEAILPVPPSLVREKDPVLAFCEALAGKIQAPVQKTVVKTRQTRPQKEMKTLAQKRANVAGAFALGGEVRGRKVLLVDDLYDSGATLEEITRLLFRCGAGQVNVLTLTRTIHADG